MTNCAWLVNSHIDIETWNEVTMDDQIDEDSMDEDEGLEETAGQLVMVDSDSESNCNSEDNSQKSQW